ncbi:hypothetical protein [Dactylosporangium matsuzakiense]|uniref:hypothetical protein n=1 Tax=Dactylosporangium matsuzakiense TaxID=53360 RepID=UPI002795B648|nr:hypothetical protein [Dactylosporangium matsuzakiense]
MQMICAQLIFQTPDLPAALTSVSPCLDMFPRPIADVTRTLDAQQHRRPSRPTPRSTACPNCPASRMSWSDASRGPAAGGRGHGARPREPTTVIHATARADHGDPRGRAAGYVDPANRSGARRARPAHRRQQEEASWQPST